MLASEDAETWVEKVVEQVGVLVMKYDDNLWYSANMLKLGTSETGDVGLYARYDDGDESVHTKLDLSTYNANLYFIRADDAWIQKFFPEVQNK